MLASVMKVPTHALDVARRTTTLSLIALGELTAVAFPRLAMPTDSIAVRAWATGYYATGPEGPAGGPVAS